VLGKLQLTAKVPRFRETAFPMLLGGAAEAIGARKAAARNNAERACVV
jgi:hypothetical protein